MGRYRLEADVPLNALPLSFLIGANTVFGEIASQPLSLDTYAL